MTMKAILTGHTRGLGEAIAGELLARHIPVLGIARKRNDALGQRYPDNLQQAQVDLADSHALNGWLAGDALRAFAGDADSLVLINNAGTVQPIGPLAAQEEQRIAQAISLNIAAPLMLSGAIAALQVSDTRILHVSSGAGRSAYAGWSVYCATKAALDHHARSVALDKSPGIRICSLAPGIIDTDMQAEIRASALERFPMRPRFDDLKRQGQLVDPKDCARRLVDYLLSPRFGQTPVADLREVA